MSEQSRVADLLANGVEEPVLPMSRVEAILRGEKITPMSRIEELLLEKSPGGGDTEQLQNYLFDKLVVNSRYSAGTWSDGIFAFSIDEYNRSWTSFASLTSIAIDFSTYSKFLFDVNITEQKDYSELSVIISPVLYTWGSSEWPGIFTESNKIDAYITESGSYELDTSLISGNQYVYIIANTSTHLHRGNEFDGKIIGTVSNLRVKIN